ncbi:MAG: hypothetical protein II847_03975, partial [Ruminobacter sp.]|uniref:hypothetical protein n=1 Tax=Ruminobacter sp. TaxID=2774296 RepID=UPI00258001F4
ICGYLRYFVCLVWSLIQYKNTDGFSIIKVHQRAGILPTIMPEASKKSANQIIVLRNSNEFIPLIKA